MSLVLDAAQLSRIFGTGERAFTAVDRVSLRISSGEIHALLGPNGAGKTTTVQMCSTLLTPTSGTLTVNGIDAIAHPQRARRHVGLALGGDSGFYPRASARHTPTPIIGSQRTMPVNTQFGRFETQLNRHLLVLVHPSRMFQGSLQRAASGATQCISQARASSGVG